MIGRLGSIIGETKVTQSRQELRYPDQGVFFPKSVSNFQGFILLLLFLSRQTVKCCRYKRKGRIKGSDWLLCDQ